MEEEEIEGRRGENIKEKMRRAKVKEGRGYRIEEEGRIRGEQGGEHGETGRCIRKNERKKRRKEKKERNERKEKRQTFKKQKIKLKGNDKE